MARKLGETLIRLGALDEARLDEALRSQRIFGGSLGSNLLQLGFVDENALCKALSAMYDVPAATRTMLMAAPPEVVTLLPVDFCRRHRALPFRVDGHRIHLALQNPSDSLAIHEAAFLSGFQVVAHVTPEAAIRDALNFHHRVDPGPSRSAGPAVKRAKTSEAPRQQTRETPPTRPSDEDALRTGPVRVRQDPPVTMASKPPIDDDARRTAPRRQAPMALEDVGRALADAPDKASILDIGFNEMSHHSPRYGVFVVRGRVVRAWKLSGFPGVADRVIEASLGEKSVFDPVNEGNPFSFGPVAMTPTNRDLYTILGGRAPRVALVAPLFVKKRAVALLYGDDPEGNAPPPDFQRVRRVAALASWALESMVLRAKILRESGAENTR